MKATTDGRTDAAPRDEAQPFPLLSDFLTYLEVILGRQRLTVKEYRYDLILFFRFLRRAREGLRAPLEEISVAEIDLPFLAAVSLSECYAFLTWLTRERKAGPANRARKIAALRAFFKYLCQKQKLLEHNPCQDLESPKQVKRLPKHLSLEESQDLLNAAADTEAGYSERDYCILTLFLNCGLRLTELANIRLADLVEDRLRVIGKGNKERSVYLNGACLSALEAYLAVRPKKGLKREAEPYLFISRQGNRLANASIQRMIKRRLRAAGLDSVNYSAHKLRHTAATLMYQYGSVDIRLLQQILGHSSVSTTEIYTHIDDSKLHEAVEKNPLAGQRARGHRAPSAESES